MCSVDVEVRVKHKKLMWTLSLGLYTSPVSSSTQAVLGASPRTQCYEETATWKGRILESTAKSKGGGNVGGPSGGLSGMQSKQVVGRGEALNPFLLLSL